MLSKVFPQPIDDVATGLWVVSALFGSRDELVSSIWMDLECIPEIVRYMAQGGIYELMIVLVLLEPFFLFFVGHPVDGAGLGLAGPSDGRIVALN